MTCKPHRFCVHAHRAPVCTRGTLVYVRVLCTHVRCPDPARVCITWPTRASCASLAHTRLAMIYAYATSAHAQRAAGCAAFVVRLRLAPAQTSGWAARFPYGAYKRPATAADGNWAAAASSTNQVTTFLDGFTMADGRRASSVVGTSTCANDSAFDPPPHTKATCRRWHARAEW